MEDMVGVRKKQGARPRPLPAHPQPARDEVKRGRGHQLRHQQTEIRGEKNAGPAGQCPEQEQRGLIGRGVIAPVGPEWRTEPLDPLRDERNTHALSRRLDASQNLVSVARVVSRQRPVGCGEAPVVNHPHKASHQEERSQPPGRP